MASSALIDTLGFLGSGIVAASAPLQLYKSCTSQSTKDLGWAYLLSYITGIYLIFVYALLADLPPIYVPICVEIVCATNTLFLKIKLDVLMKKKYSREFGTDTSEDKDSDSSKDVIIEVSKRKASDSEVELMVKS